ncbi:hypothetical protein [Leisingera caerulea]
MSWAGGRLVEVDLRNTSRTCGYCSHVDTGSPLLQVGGLHDLSTQRSFPDLPTFAPLRGRILCRL